MDGYIRVSRRMGREGVSYISPSVQKEAIERWAAYHDVTIAMWHVDEDQSGGTQQRPGLREAMRRIEVGDTEGIACWKLNRFARNVVSAIEDIERIQALHADLVCVEENIDTRGPIGEFVLVILLAVAKLERDNIVQSWKITKGRALKRGVMLGPTPYGYSRQPDSTLTPDPLTAPHVIEAYHAAAAGGPEAAHAYLTANAHGRRWTMATVRRTLANRVYLGEIVHDTSVIPDSHEALVSRPIWEAAQWSPRRRAKAALFPLSGLARCGTCGEPMVGGRAGTRKNAESRRTYRCRATLTYHKGERCRRGAHVLADALEQYLSDLLRPALASRTIEGRDTPDDDLTLVERALAEAEAELDAFTADMTLRRAVGEARYHEHLHARVSAVEGARERYRLLARRRQASERINATETLDNPAELAELLRSLFAAIIVAPGRGNLPDRVQIVPIDDDLTSGPPAAPDPQ